MSPLPEIVSDVLFVVVVVFVAVVVVVVVVVVVAADGGNLLQLWPPHLRHPPKGQLRSLRGLQSLSSRRHPESCRTHPRSPFCPFPHSSPRLLLLSPGIWKIHLMVNRDLDPRAALLGWRAYLCKSLIIFVSL